MGSSGQKYFNAMAQVPGELSITFWRSGQRAQKGQTECSSMDEGWGKPRELGHTDWEVSGHSLCLKGHWTG